VLLVLLVLLVGLLVVLLLALLLTLLLSLRLPDYPWKEGAEGFEYLPRTIQCQFVVYTSVKGGKHYVMAARTQEEVRRRLPRCCC